jgi:gliding motility-associated lipoprotein GldH
MRWDASKSVIFNASIPKGTYQQILVFRYGEGYPFKKLKIHLTTISSSKEYTNKDFIINIMDKNGNYIGDGLGEIWDIEMPLDTIKITSPQKLKFTISQKTYSPYLPMVMEVGIRLKKIKK